MSEQASILYVPEMAKMLGRTEAAIRTAVNRSVDWLPAPFPMGRRLAWRREDVDAFIAAQAKKTGR